jgi:hypothetical protein
VRDLDVEGIVAKWKHGVFVPRRSSRIDGLWRSLVQNPQAEARYT